MKFRFSLMLLAISTLALWACNQTKKTTSDTTAAIMPSQWPATPGTISVIGDAGNPNTFVFEKWRFASIEMPGGQVEKIKLALEISTASLTTDWKDLEKSVRHKPDYFDVDKFPVATVSINGAQATGDGNYSCNALLTLKGISKNVPLTFQISDTKPYKVKGEGMIFRSQFNFSDEGPKEEIPLSFEAELPL